MPNETETENALSVLRMDYWDDVRGVVEDLKYELKEGGVDRTYDSVTEYLTETCDGHPRVIYTRGAILTLLFSENDAAFFDIYGGGGDAAEVLFKRSDDLDYSVLAYHAFYADVMEQAEAGGVAPHQIEETEEEDVEEE